jgi:hypothetical protein
MYSFAPHALVAASIFDTVCKETQNDLLRASMGAATIGFSGAATPKQLLAPTGTNE